MSETGKAYLVFFCGLFLSGLVISYPVLGQARSLEIAIGFVGAGLFYAIFQLGLRQSLMFFALLGLGASLLGHLGSPYFFMFELLHQFQLHAFVAGLGLIVVALATSRTLLLFAAMALALSSGAAVGPVVVYEALHEAQLPEAQTPAKIISYNVMARNPDQRASLLWVQEQKADVVLLLEANHLWDAQTALLEGDLPHVVRVDHISNFGISLFSRYPVVEQETLLGGEALTPVLRADIALPQGRVRFIGAHPIIPMLAEYRALRDRQIALMSRLAQESPYPVVVLGDFNAVPWIASFAQLQHQAELTGVVLWPSWPASFFALGLPIDQIIGGKGVVVHEVKTGPLHASDHRARIAQLSVWSK